MILIAAFVNVGSGEPVRSAGREGEARQAPRVYQEAARAP